MNVSRLLLVSLPTLSVEDYDQACASRRGIPLYPPIALALLAALVRRSHGEAVVVRLFDYDYEIVRAISDGQDTSKGLEAFLDGILEEFRPDAVGLSYNFGLSTRHVGGIVSRIKAFDRDIVVFAGGNHATLYHEEIMRFVPGLDHILRYEADHSLPAFLRHLNGQAAREEVQGLCSRHGLDLDCTPYAHYPENLDLLPHPAWELTAFDTYHRFGRIGSVFNYGDPEAATYTLYATRGCGGNCKFCTSKAFNGAKVRYRSADSILDELEEAGSRWGITQFEILDDDFTFSRERALEFSRKLARRKLGMKWNLLNGIRLVTLDEELVAAMAESGLRLISVGIESCHPVIMRKIRKQLTPDLLHRKMELLNRHPEIYVKGNFIFGFPYETWEHIEHTARVAGELVMDWHIFSIFTPLPNTPLFKEVESLIPDFSRKYMLNKFKLDVYDIGASGGDDYDYLKDLIGIGMREMTEYISMLNFKLNFLENKNYLGRDLARAARDFEGILRFIKPDHAVAHHCLAQIYARMGRPRDGAPHAEAFREIVARDPFWKDKAIRLGLEPASPAEARA